MKRHAPCFLEIADHDSVRVTGLDQRTDGEAQLVNAIRVEKRAKQRGTAFAEHLSQPALRRAPEAFVGREPAEMKLEELPCEIELSNEKLAFSIHANRFWARSCALRRSVSRSRGGAWISSE